MFLTARDQMCRTPWCGAPIRHADHAVAVSKGGQTDLRNGNGRCARCNLTKDLDGWATHVLAGVITTTTPTGHQYTGRPPAPPTSTPWAPQQDSQSTARRVARRWRAVAGRAPYEIEIYLPRSGEPRWEVARQ